MNKDVYIIAGPTASGKSARALELAVQNDGIIINCDSMQIYNALPILTAQPSEHDKTLAPHKLYGFLHPNESTSAGDWVRIASSLIEETLQHNQTPIICGGTGLYIKALMDGLSPMPEISKEIREQTIVLHNEIGTPELHKRLESADPSIKDRFHRNHSARIMRAWEVLEATGKSITYWQSLPPIPPPAHWQFKLEIIMPEREKLYANIDTRFSLMLENGALEETAEFSNRIESGEINKNALVTKALSFKELRTYLNGDISKDEAIEQSQTTTRQYAKRQMTWFRNQF
jgi:tRNA dimethylallyltransferase